MSLVKIAPSNDGRGDMSDKLLDAKGLRCPLPVLKARRAMKDMEAGQVIEILSTDPTSVPDFKAFCETTGHELLTSRQDGEVFVFEIRKTA